MSAMKPLMYREPTVAIVPEEIVATSTHAFQVPTHRPTLSFRGTPHTARPGPTG